MSPMGEEELGVALVGWGKVLRIETGGRVSGRPARAVIGFAEEPDGSMVVAAGDPDADWAQPRATATVGDATWTVVAERLEGGDHAAAVTALILKYGTPAERLGRGPAYRLRRE